MEFSEWITKKYIEWRGNAIGNEKSITKFADKLGVTHSLMTQWMKKGGKVPNSQKYISALIREYGVEAYDVLGIPNPEPTAFKEMVKDLKELSAAIKSIRENNGTEIASPEDIERINSILSNFSSKYQEIDGFWEVKKE